jgi:hypothetical protein
MEIGNVIEAIKNKRFRVTDHADEEANADRLSLDDILISVLGGEIIEDYPDDSPYSSCLILGKTASGEPVHSVWAYNIENRWTVLVTVYRPDPQRWIEWKRREK